MQADEHPLLIVEDREDVAAALELLCALHEVPAVVARSPAEALTWLRRQRCGAVLQDMNFSRELTSGAEGVALFRAIRATHPRLPVLLMTAWASLEMAVALVKEGADDYIAKPWVDEVLVGKVRAALARSRAEAGELVAVSEPMHSLLGLVARVAPSPAPVLITGPNGSGKERIAELVHQRSGRRGPLVRVDTGALPEALLEAELFGAEAGAYTGAVRRREGLFEAARGGTLFLDEIANLPLAGQAKLLRVLETGDYHRLGSTKVERAEVRVVAATNAELEAQVERGAFRQDLYFRLAVVELRVPPLRERPDDILPLAEHFLRLEGGGRALGPQARAALLAHVWPGNVRELSNRIRRALLVSAAPALGPDDLGLGGRSEPPRGPARSSEPPRGLARPSSPPREARPEGEASGEGGAGPAGGEEVEPGREALIAALERCGWVVARAAASLGLSRQAFYRRMQRLGLRLERQLK